MQFQDDASSKGSDVEPCPVSITNLSSTVVVVDIGHPRNGSTRTGLFDVGYSIVAIVPPEAQDNWVVEVAVDETVRIRETLGPASECSLNGKNALPGEVAIVWFGSAILPALQVPRAPQCRLRATGTVAAVFVRSVREGKRGRR